MKRFFLIPILVLAVIQSCTLTKDDIDLPYGDISSRWSEAASAFYEDAISMQAPHEAQPFSIMAVEHGKVVFEKWYDGKGPESTTEVYSVSKTVLAIAAGFAVDEGLFSVEDRVTDFFPDQLPEHVSDNLSSMKIRHLLTMTCGLEESAKLLSVFKGDADFDWISEFFASNQVDSPGERFYYNLFTPYILAAIIQKTSGMTVMDYIKPRLLEPMHITDMGWDNSPAGICTGGWLIHRPGAF